MKKLLLPVLFFTALSGYCQDAVKLQQIDSLVKVINQSNFKTEYDSLSQDYPDLGLFMKTNLTTVTNGNELKKYVNHVNTIRQEKGISRQMVTSNAFYFDQNKLIKVEEFGIEGDKEIHADWYYSEGKPLYYTFQSDRSESRAAFLLTLAETMLKQIQK